MTNEIALYCMKAYSEYYSEVCEECPIYGETGTDHCFEDALEMAIKALETIPKYKDAYNKGWDDGAKATYEHLKMCEEEREPKWIPVSERLPEDGERVLVTYDKIVIRATWDLMRYSFYDTHAVSLDKDFVYAWMPLPKPYEPQESEG